MHRLSLRPIVCSRARVRHIRTLPTAQAAKEEWKLTPAFRRLEKHPRAMRGFGLFIAGLQHEFGISPQDTSPGQRLGQWTRIKQTLYLFSRLLLSDPLLNYVRTPSPNTGMTLRGLRMWHDGMPEEEFFTFVDEIWMLRTDAEVRDRWEAQKADGKPLEINIGPLILGVVVSGGIYLVFGSPSFDSPYSSSILGGWHFDKPESNPV